MKVGGACTAWDGYIGGKNLALQPGRRIVQSWRCTQFTDNDADSKITVTLTPVERGTRVTLTHSEVPNGHTSYEHGGWQDHHFTSMKAFSPDSIP